MVKTEGKMKEVMKIAMRASKSGKIVIDTLSVPSLRSIITVIIYM